MQAVTIERTWKLKDGQETHIVAGDLVTIHHIYAFAHTTRRDPTYGWGWWRCLKTIFAPEGYFKTIPLKERISKAREYRRKLFSTWHTRRRTHYDFEAVATVDGKFQTFLWDEFCDELMYEIWEEVATEHKIAA
tara:strand:- start:474 stop:875 length:402 start_codon:yes stop_codon:yes gene_type:complete